MLRDLKRTYDSAYRYGRSIPYGISSLPHDDVVALTKAVADKVGQGSMSDFIHMFFWKRGVIRGLSDRRKPKSGPLYSIL